jgi:hypothetical protein
LDSLGLIPKISLGNGAKLSIDPSLTLDGGLWTGNLNLGIKDWSPFPNPALTFALALDTEWDSDGGYSLDGSLAGKLNLNPTVSISAGCEFKNGSKGTSWGWGTQVSIKY